MEDLINTLQMLMGYLISEQYDLAEHFLDELIKKLYAMEEKNINNIWEFDGICLN